MQLFYDHHLHAKKSKCVFGQTKVEYLRHIISAQGVHVDHSKITAMNNWPPPKTLKSLRGFFDDQGSLSTISIPVPNWLQSVQQGYVNDS